MVGTHALGTLIVISSVYFYTSLEQFVVMYHNNQSHIILFTLLGLTLFDFIVHFVVDRVKAHPDLGGRWKADNPKFWWALGGDQAIHHLTHYIIIYVLVF